MTEHPGVMLERLLRDKHNLILENEKLRAALREISEGYDGGEVSAVMLKEIAQLALSGTR